MRLNLCLKREVIYKHKLKITNKKSEREELRKEDLMIKRLRYHPLIIFAISSMFILISISFAVSQKNQPDIIKLKIQMSQRGHRYLVT